MDSNDERSTTIASHVTNTLQPEPNIYATVDEYADRLKVSRGTVFGWVKGGLPSFRIGRTRRVVIEKADRWLESGGADHTRKSTRSKRSPSSGRRSSDLNAEGRQ
jgi:excisionase family DNA binding protein